MRQIIALFIRNGGFLTFLLLEVFCFYLIINFNTHQNSIFTYSTGLVSGEVLNKRRSVSQYINAAEQIDSLQRVVANLRTQLAGRYFVQKPFRDTFIRVEIDSLEDTDLRPKYKYIAAQIISNSIAKRDNWFIINAGTADGIREGMGVVVPKGVLGIVRSCNADFSICMSILHQQSRVSARLQKQKVMGSLQYDGFNPDELSLEDIPKHVVVEKGDVVETSGYSSMYPGGIPIGKVDSIYLPRGSNFYSIKVNLDHDLSNTDYVYVVDYIFREGIDSLIQSVK